MDVAVSREEPHPRQGAPSGSVIVGLDSGGTSNNATVLDDSGFFLVDGLLESPSRVHEGPRTAVAALAEAFDQVLQVTGVPRESVSAVGLGTPGPASAAGVLSSKGSTNFSEQAWRGFDVRGALEKVIGIPVIYSNDGNAAALYAHRSFFGPESADRSSVSAIVGTGLGGGIVEAGRVIRGACGMAGELGHVQIPMEGLLADGQPTPECNCGNRGDAESVASLTAIEKSLLPFWLTRHRGHELAGMASMAEAAKLVRGLRESDDELAIEILEQQAMALGRLFTLVGNLMDPSAYFVGGGVVEASPRSREWFLDQVSSNTSLRHEQRAVVSFALIPDLDMAGARGAALAAAQSPELG
jgi:predicted NBD/HSP70 family sugar kinase